MLPTERRAVAVVALVAICRMFGLFALLPVIGIAVGGYGLTQAALQIPFGALSDRIGRLPVILLGLALFAAGSIMAALSDDIHGVIIGRLLQGAGAISATLTALLADATREEMRTRSMAFFGVAIGSSFLLALVLGPAIAAAFGIRSLFWMAAGLAVVAGLLLTLLPRGIERPAQPPDRSIWKAFRPDLVKLHLYIFLLHAVLTASFVALPFLLRNTLGMPVESHWKMYIGALAASLVLTVPLIISDERQGKASTVGLSIMLVALGQLLLAVWSGATLNVFIALAVFFGGFNFLEAGLPARLSIQASGEVRGASLGVFSSAQFLGAFVGGLAGGLLYSGSGPRGVFLAAALLGALWFSLERILSRKQ
jgi:MFS family permease